MSKGETYIHLPPGYVDNLLTTVLEKQNNKVSVKPSVPKEKKARKVGSACTTIPVTPEFLNRLEMAVGGSTIAFAHRYGLTKCTIRNLLLGKTNRMQRYTFEQLERAFLEIE